MSCLHLTQEGKNHIALRCGCQFFFKGLQEQDECKVVDLRPLDEVVRQQHSFIASGTANSCWFLNWSLTPILPSTFLAKYNKHNTSNPPERNEIQFDSTLSSLCHCAVKEMTSIIFLSMEVNSTHPISLSPN